MKTEVFAAQLQLQELQAQLQCRADAKIAMSVYLQHNNGAHEQIGDQQHDSMESSIPLDDWETCQLQEQIAALTLLVNTHDSQRVAASLQAQEEANDAALNASLQVADRLAEQESWHKRIIDHDAEFARSLAFCDSEEWEANGDNLESPLQLGPRPSSPEVNNFYHSGVAIATSPSHPEPQQPAPSDSCHTSGVAIATSSMPHPSSVPHPNTSSSNSSSGRDLLSTPAHPPEVNKFFHSGVAIATFDSSHARQQPSAPLDFHFTSGVAIADSMPHPNSSSSGLRSNPAYTPEINSCFHSGVAITTANISNEQQQPSAPLNVISTSGAAIADSMPHPNSSSSGLLLSPAHTPEVNNCFHSGVAVAAVAGDNEQRSVAPDLCFTSGVAIADNMPRHDTITNNSSSRDLRPTPAHPPEANTCYHSGVAIAAVDGDRQQRSAAPDFVFTSGVASTSRMPHASNNKQHPNTSSGGSSSSSSGLLLDPVRTPEATNCFHSGVAIAAVDSNYARQQQPSAPLDFYFTSGVAIADSMPHPNNSSMPYANQSSSSSRDLPSTPTHPPGSNNCLQSGVVIATQYGSGQPSRPPDFVFTSGVAVADIVPHPNSNNNNSSSSSSSSRGLHWNPPPEVNSLLHSGVATAAVDSNNAQQKSPAPFEFVFTSGVAIAGSMPNLTSSSNPAASAIDKGKRPMQSSVPTHYNNNNTNSSSSSTAGKNNTTPELVQCGICFDEFPASSMMSAVLPQQQASSSSSEGRCGHHFCCGCMKIYVQEQIKAHKYPICCPMPSCREEISHDDVSRLLKEHTKELQVFDMLVLEHSIDASLRVYCPFKDCSCLLERPEDMDVDDGGQEVQPFECPSCHRWFCLHCKTAGWHMGMTCQQFQALPPELRSVEDAAMLRMAAANAWKRCPGCGVFVERIVGCNHMSCRCGVNFCYACGEKYTSTEPSADNVHGTPGCACPLFTVPEEEPVVAAPVPVAVPAPAAVMLRPVRLRPWRGGRQVSRTRCWHSGSIYDCPNGHGRCWFWHDEDDYPE